MSEPGDLTSEVIAGKYELLRLLGAGGMGAVYEARHVGTRKRCAVKLLLKPELASDAEVSRRFFREARASGLIENDHVVAAYDSGVDAAGRLYYVMECLNGEDLSELLERVGSLTPAAVVKLMLQACTGLIGAHALGIVHRDIKPGNLFLSVGAGDEVKVKILDFGVAKVKMEVFEESADSLTRMGSLLGTPQYMSPEQVKRASAINESADIWSLGIVMYECLAGTLPWVGVESVGELIAAILTLEVPLVQDAAPWVKAELAHVVQRALSRDAGRRLQNATELRDALLTLSTGDTRLYLHELRAPTELERGTVAPRLALADTLPLGAGGSGMPVVGSIAPRKASRWGLIGAAATVAGAAAWTLSQPQPPANVDPTTVDATRASLAAAIETSPAPATPSPPPTRTFALEIAPTTATATLDGVSTSIRDGRLTIEGPVGSVHTVRISHGGQTREQSVAITTDGLIPPKLVLPLPQPPNNRPSADPRRLPAPVSAPSTGPASTTRPAPTTVGSGMWPWE